MKITLHCYIINYYLTQWTDNRMPDKRGTDNRGSTVFKNLLRSLKVQLGYYSKSEVTHSYQYYWYFKLICNRLMTYGMSLNRPSHSKNEIATAE